MNLYNKVVFSLILAKIIFSNELHGQFVSHVYYPDTTLFGQVDTKDPSIVLAKTINSEDLKSILGIIADDNLEGREVGTLGNLNAANYIASEYKKLGIPWATDSSYFQKMRFDYYSWEEKYLKINGQEYSHLQDYLAFQEKSKDLRLKGNQKVCFLPGDESIEKIKSCPVVLVYDDPDRDENIFLELVGEKRVKLVLSISDKILSIADKFRTDLVRKKIIGQKRTNKSESKRANLIYVSPSLAKSILGDKYIQLVIKSRDDHKAGKNSKIITIPKVIFDLKQKIIHDSMTGRNVAAYIEGSDLKDELVIISGHFDHLGIRNNLIYNGADDNGSGTSTLLEIGEALSAGIAHGIRPRRSIMLLHLTAEEVGLYGSEYYINFPLFPLNKTVVDINIDMVGRYDAKYSNSPWLNKYTYVIGSDRISKSLHRVNEEVNEKYEKLALDYTFNSEKDPNRFYYRSDHFNFAQKNIPSIFFFTGMHDDYHKPTDDIDKIKFDFLEKRARHYFHLAWELANRDKSIREYSE